MFHQSNRPIYWLAVLAFAIATAGLEGCTAWPGPATGGLAERKPTQWPALRSLEQRHDAAVRAGGDRFAAGRMAELRLLITRAQREEEGGLLADADVSLAKADRLLAAIERDLNTNHSGNRSRPRYGA